MCGRFTLRTAPADIASFFGIQIPDCEISPRYNIAPTQNISVVVEQEVRNWSFFRWGLVPFWAKDLSIGARMINARGETIAEKPSFRKAFAKRRCLVLADGFYEWEKTPDGKKPHYFTLQDESVMAFAGLWEKWSKGDSPVQTCTIVTTSANELLDPLHDRMPVILDSADFEQWLDPDFSEKQPLQKLLKSYPAEEMKSRLVNPIVNNAKNESPECLDEN